MQKISKQKSRVKASKQGSQLLLVHQLRVIAAQAAKGNRNLNKSGGKGNESRRGPLAATMPAGSGLCRGAGQPAQHMPAAPQSLRQLLRARDSKRRLQCPCYWPPRSHRSQPSPACRAGREKEWGAACRAREKERSITPSSSNISLNAASSVGAPAAHSLVQLELNVGKLHLPAGSGDIKI